MMSTAHSPYATNLYGARIVSWYDADTPTLNLDLGQRVVLQDQRCRLIGIDAPEVRLGRGTTPEEKARGVAARDHVRMLWPEGTEGWAQTIEKGKYGRWIIELYLPLKDLPDRHPKVLPSMLPWLKGMQWCNVSAYLLCTGMAQKG